MYSYKWWRIICGLIGTVVIGATEEQSRMNSRILSEIIKSSNDDKEYRAIELENKVKMMLVRDSNVTRAAVALCVPAGSLNDPPYLEGLAHFTEHMLFLGSKNFPREDGFLAKIDKLSGSFNAFTDNDHTCYYVDVAANNLQPALEHFADMFDSPLFTPSGVEREVNAVESEFRNDIISEDWQHFRIKTVTGKRGHPYTQFTTGSLFTLWTAPNRRGIDVRQSVIDFHAKYYSSNLIHVTIFGMESLDELQSMGETAFSPISNRNVTTPIWLDHVYGKDELQERIEYVPVNNKRMLSVIFPIDYFPELRRSMAYDYLKDLLQRESNGSLTHLLKEKKWAEEIIVYPNSPGRWFAYINIEITLSRDGMNFVSSIVQLLFQYFEMLRRSEPQEWLCNELIEIAKLEFKYPQNVDPSSFATSLSQKFLYASPSYPLEKILYPSIYMDMNGCDAPGISSLLSKLYPQNCRIFIRGKEFENRTVYTEQPYGIKYNRAKIQPYLIKEWEKSEVHPNFHFPQPNQLMPERFELKGRDVQSEENPTVPRKLVGTNFSSVWYLQDNIYMQPKTVVIVALQSPFLNMDPLRNNSANLLMMLIEEITKDLIRTNIVKLEVEGVLNDLKLIFYSYDDKIGAFVYRVFEQLSNLLVSREQFERMKEKRARKVKDLFFEQSHRQAEWEYRALIIEQQWTNSELLEAMHDLTFEQFKTFIKDFFSRLKLTWLFYGNLTPQEALRISRRCETFLTDRGTEELFQSQWGCQRMVEFPQGSSHIYKLSLPVSQTCTVLLFQTGLESPKTNALNNILEKILHSRCFDQLRTKEQLGYLVWAVTYQDGEYPAYRLEIVVQGSVNAEYVESRIDNVLKTIHEHLENISEKDFRSVKESVKTEGSKKPETMLKKGIELFYELQINNTSFRRRQDFRAAVDFITLREFREFFIENIANPLTRRRLVLHVNPLHMNVNEVQFKNYSVTPSTEIRDMATWKRTMKLLPCSNSRRKAITASTSLGNITKFSKVVLTILTLARLKVL